MKKYKIAAIQETKQEAENREKWKICVCHILIKQIYTNRKIKQLCFYNII